MTPLNDTLPRTISIYIHIVDYVLGVSVNVEASWSVDRDGWQLLGFDIEFWNSFT